jgi:hypothetical protein
MVSRVQTLAKTRKRRSRKFSKAKMQSDDRTHRRNHTRPIKFNTPPELTDFLSKRHLNLNRK